MIEVYTSYFYQIRNMDAGCLAFSTALGDPLWFHEGTRDKSYKFIDKHGRINGLRAEPFVPRFNANLKNPCKGPEDCNQFKLQWYCEFLEEYYKLLSKLDPHNIEQRFRRVGQEWLEFLEEDIPLTYILLVHEAPTNPCSERIMLQKWLKENNMGGKEWSKECLKSMVKN